MIDTKVTCAQCKARIEKKDAYCVSGVKNNTYYCNAEHFALSQKKKNEKQKEKEQSNIEKAEYDAIFEQTKKIFGYDFQSYGILKKEVKTWEKLANRTKILCYLTENERFLASTLSKKNFDNDFNRVRYYSVVVASKLHDYNGVPRVEPEKVIVNREVYEPVVSSKKKRRGLSELEDEVDMIGD